jgi:hypothetical protein
MQSDCEMSSEPLSDAELETLSGVLKTFGGKDAMNVEQMDGFLAALTCGPVDISPHEAAERNRHSLGRGEMTLRRPLPAAYWSEVACSSAARPGQATCLCGGRNRG